ncbi:PREDICTED: E3 SUMO-protein ligase PIAS4 isoform X1 [Gavialis gangeticus]|uniref:E3 SUMO-protein ligase PIAS4 isoform X1 n=1 Tax=Gavialis gangeticus TaxID=94835 RepID=UPI00092F58FE|nr:PREDICTED: E3 SUMO-protein ligase PIAS4 isoform X1 [Gavialis gangeticus]
MAAELVEAKNMVMSFRVSDLQMLLGYVGRSKSGLKHELVTRALQLVQFDCSPEVFKKIKELYETRYAKKSSDSGQPQQQPHRPPETLSIHSSYDRGSTVARTSISTTNIDYPAIYGKYLNGLGRLPPKVVKPEVRLVKLPFYNILDELLKPTELVPQNNEKLQESPCIFALTSRQVDLIRNSSEQGESCLIAANREKQTGQFASSSLGARGGRGSGTKHEASDPAPGRELQPGVKSVQVVLRICYTDTSSPQEDQYPPNIAVKVNHSYCSVPGYYPSNKPGVEPKRPCRPINLTHLLYLSGATNRITVTWGNYGKSYSVGLYLVRQLTSAELLQKLKTIGVKHPELCKTLVKEKLRLDPDSEIATTGVRVSLICPLVKMRLSVPCRAETCAHLQCFDAVFYLQMNEKKPTWMCPVCDKPAPYDQLIIDGLLSKILTECEDADEIEYMADGSWCPIRAEKERSCSPQCPILVLGSSDVNGLLPTPNSNGENGKVTADVVDLTLDSSSSEEEEEEDEEEDDDDDGPQPKRRCSYEKDLVSAC